MSHSNDVIMWKMTRKHFENGRKYCLPAFSTFPTLFSKGLFFWVTETRDCVEEQVD